MQPSPAFWKVPLISLHVLKDAVTFRYVPPCITSGGLICSIRSDTFCATLPGNLKSVAHFAAWLVRRRYVPIRSALHYVHLLQVNVTFRYVLVTFWYVLPCVSLKKHVFRYVPIRSVQQYRWFDTFQIVLIRPFLIVYWGVRDTAIYILHIYLV